MPGCRKLGCPYYGARWDLIQVFSFVLFETLMAELALLAPRTQDAHLKQPFMR